MSVRQQTGTPQITRVVYSEPNVDMLTAEQAHAGRGTDLLAERSQYSNYRQLVERTIDVFGDERKASLWLSTPSSDLQGKVPMQVAQSVGYARTELDRIFEPIFLGIEHGIYS